MLSGQQTKIGRRVANFFVIDTAAVVFYFDVYVIAPMVGTNSHIAMIGLARLIALFRALDTVRHRVANQVQQRIGDLLNNVVVEFGVVAFQLQVDQLVRSLRRVAGRASDARIKVADRHHARLRDFILQTMRKLGELINVAINPTHKSIELAENLGDVGRDFRQRAREDVELVIAIHFQLAELSERGIERVRVTRIASAERIRLAHRPARIRWREATHRGERRIVLRARLWLRAAAAENVVELVLLLELGDLVDQPCLGEVQHIGQAFQFSHAP